MRLRLNGLSDLIFRGYAKGGSEQTGAVSVDVNSGAKKDIDLSEEDALAYNKAAELSINANDDSCVPEGFTRVSDEQLISLGLEPDNFVDHNSGLYSALYQDNETGEYTLAFQGSESDEWSDIKEDWFQSNAGQALTGSLTAYRQAEKLAESVKSQLGDEVLLTGHSLGGGLANYAAIANNLDYTIFNAAGLSDSSVAQLGESVESYSGKGVVINDQYDPLTSIGGGYNDETWGGKHIGVDTLIFVNNTDCNSGFWGLNIFDPFKRSEAHSVDENILQYLANEANLV